MTDDTAAYNVQAPRWHCVKMSVGDITVGKHIRLQSAFEAVFLATLAREDVAMFGNRAPEQDYTYWFSPHASELFTTVLAAIGASDCFAPPRESVILLVGRADALKMLSRKDVGA